MPKLPANTPLRSEDGFTLVEVLVATIAALVLAGALMTFLITTIDQQNAVSSQSVATRQGEVGLAQFVRDFRDAENNPVATSGTYPLANRTPVVITYTTGSAAGFSASFYTAPAGGCDGSSTSRCDQVTWSCTAASGGVPGSCTRTCTAPSAALAAGACAFGAAVHSEPEVTGLAAATITPTDASGNPITTAVSGIPPGMGPSYPSYVGVSFSIETISQSDTGTPPTHTVAGSSNVMLSGGVNLRNYS
jgi:type II secretory pathway pseudopilin PulG